MDKKQAEQQNVPPSESEYRNKKRETMQLIYKLNFHVTGRLYYLLLIVVLEVNLTGAGYLELYKILNFHSIPNSVF